MEQHPHQAFLDELEIAIKELVPLTPAEIVEEAKALHKTLTENPAATLDQVHKALVEIGRKEYPYRKAYHDMCDGDEEKRLKELVFERIDEKVKKKIQETVEYVLLEDFVQSDMFEEMLTGEERYQVSNAITMAQDTLDHQCTDECTHKQEAFAEMVEARKKEAQELQGMIHQLQEIANTHPDQASEIQATIDRLEEGWSITERDPEKQEIAKEIEYWKEVVVNTDEADLGTFGEDVEEVE